MCHYLWVLNAQYLIPIILNRQVQLYWLVQCERQLESTAQWAIQGGHWYCSVGLHTCYSVFMEQCLYVLVRQSN